MARLKLAEAREVAVSELRAFGVEAAEPVRSGLLSGLSGLLGAEMLLATGKFVLTRRDRIGCGEVSRFVAWADIVSRDGFALTAL